MADPLSVAASVVGLLTAAAQISQTLYDITKRAKKAPKECKDARMEVDDIRNILSQLQLFVLGAAKASRSRSSLILVEQVVTTLAATVTTFSELDVFVETLESDERMGLMDRLRWVSKEKALNELIQKLQLHKSSMGLMLTILTCQSTVEAEDKVDKLCDLVEQTLKQNLMLAERLSSFESGSTVVQNTNQASQTEQHLRKNQTLQDEQGPEESQSFQPAPQLQQEVEGTTAEALAKDVDSSLQLGSEAMIQEPDVGDGLNEGPSQLQQSAIQRNPRAFVFEELLMKSRVYRNMAWDSDDAFSILSSAGRTGTWSMLSGLSLSQMSNIAILALPVYATDLGNKERYDFNSITEEPTVPTGSPAEDSPQQSPRSRTRIFSSWRKRLTANTASPAQEDTPPSNAPSVMGVRLEGSIRYANVAISLQNEDGESFIYGYVPILVAKCGVFLTEAGTEVENIFATSGHPTRVLTLEKIFNDPARNYGKGFSWAGFTIHDCAALLLRYLKCLPEPVIPYHHYEQLTAPFRNYSNWLQLSDTDKGQESEPMDSLVKHTQQQVLELPSLNRQLLLYLLDKLAVFASRAELNKMPSARLVSAFHPAVLSRRPQEMDEGEHRLAQDIVIFFVEQQDNFLIGLGPPI